MFLRLGLLGLWGLLWVAHCDAAETRVALIIGNGKYAKADMRLANPTNDASAMQRALQSAGFETILKLNATRRDMYRAVDEFSAKIARDQHAVGLFYFAGHGVQADGTNYLIPVDAEVESEADLDANAYDVAKVLQAMQRAQNDMNIVILDACRDNDLPKTRGVSRGLARIIAPSGTFIAYAAAPGQVAQDGASGTNGVFTGELIKSMAEPNVPLEQMFKKVIIGVKADTHGQQTPWSEASVQGDFYFRSKSSAAVVPQVSGPAPTAPASAGTHIPTAAELDEQYWQGIMGSKDAADFASYIKNYPKGLHLAQAQLMVRKLSPQPEVARSPVQLASVLSQAAAAAADSVGYSAPPPQPAVIDGSAQERRDYGVPATSSLHSQMEGPTPASIPGGRLITTKEVLALIQSNSTPYLLLDALGGNATLRGAQLFSRGAAPGMLGDYIEKQMGQWLYQATGGNRNMALVIFCQSSHCWMSYNAALRAIDLGYRNVLWYRGGLEAWTQSGLPTITPGSHY
jgi:PQQ-dependent catabolism-associated CXXCW motif protein